MSNVNIPTTAVIPFQFQSTEIRTLTDEKDNLWFIAKDVCDVLEHSKVTMAVAGLDEDEVRKVYLADSVGRQQEMLIISEAGFYRLTIRSNKPQAKPFTKWVTTEVLPTIRKTGSYNANPVDPSKYLNDPAAMRGLLLTYTEKVLTLQATVTEQAPIVSAFNRIATESTGSMCITDAAKALQVQPQVVLFPYLSGVAKWIYRRAGGKGWLGYQDKVQQGLVEHKVTEVTRGDGTKKLTEHVLITSKGLAKLSQIFTQQEVTA